MVDTSVVRAFLEERHVSLAAEVTAFAGREVATLPIAADDASARTQARVLMAKIGRGGWFAHVLPPAYGGSQDGPDLRACCLIREALAFASPLADAVFALQALGSMPLTLSAEEPLRKKWLPLVARGEAMGAFAMTESEAGSDVAALKTSAKREGDIYVLEGSKTFISNAGIADFYSTFAVTDPAKGKKGISCFCVDAKTPGVRFDRAQVMSAPHPLGEISYVRVRIPASCRIGAEGEGLSIGLATLDRLRATVGAAACGMAARALSEATAHVLRRKQFGKPLAEFQLVQEKIAQMATELTAARLLVYRASWEKDRGAERVTMESAMAKAYATEAAQRIVDGSLQLLGGLGALADHPVDRLYRAVRSLRIYEGTTEIQNLVIAGQLLKKTEDGSQKSGG